MSMLKRCMSQLTRNLVWMQSNDNRYGKHSPARMQIDEQRLAHPRVRGSLPVHDPIMEKTMLSGVISVRKEGDMLRKRVFHSRSEWGMTLVSISSFLPSRCRHCVQGRLRRCRQQRWVFCIVPARGHIFIWEAICWTVHTESALLRSMHTPKLTPACVRGRMLISHRASVFELLPAMQT